jgi:hypothetical protein
MIWGVMRRNVPVLCRNLRKNRNGNKMNFSKVYKGNSVGIMSIDRK